MTIYVDVLFVLNFFITYLLLLLTKSLIKFTSKTGRLLIGALIGGVYSLVILLPDLNFFVSLFGKLLVSLLIVASSFDIKRLTVFFKTLACFYFSNMLFLGIILALWLWIKPKGIVVNNGIPYFSIPAGILLMLALAAYV
ncbi:MAG: sigma-E processing peptidase SpoIIGA, partial [Eubacterium sp.]|nr:sigma-E processing peptidase SpoIIGA [Eubacterium sp.]